MLGIAAFVILNGLPVITKESCLSSSQSVNSELPLFTNLPQSNAKQHPGQPCQSRIFCGALLLTCPAARPHHAAQTSAPRWRKSRSNASAVPQCCLSARRGEQNRHPAPRSYQSSVSAADSAGAGPALAHAGTAVQGFPHTQSASRRCENNVSLLSAK